MGPGRGEDYQSRGTSSNTKKWLGLSLISIAYFKLKAVVTLTGVLFYGFICFSFHCPAVWSVCAVPGTIFILLNILTFAHTKADMRCPSRTRRQLRDAAAPAVPSRKYHATFQVSSFIAPRISVFC